MFNYISIYTFCNRTLKYGDEKRYFYYQISPLQEWIIRVFQKGFFKLLREPPNKHSTIALSGNINTVEKNSLESSEQLAEKKIEIMICEI